MRSHPSLVIALLGGCACPEPAVEPLGDPVDLLGHVDPFIGTGGIGYEVGCGFPGAARPFGLVKASPDTADRFGQASRAYRGGGYHYDDVYVQGFSHMHMYAIGSTDYGLVALMPADGMDAARTSEEGYRLPFDHAQESASPGLYEVAFDDPAVQVRLTATDHTALHRYVFDASVAEPVLILDLCHTLGEGICLGAELTIDPSTGAARGSVHNYGEMAAPFEVWFEIRFDPAPVAWGTWEGSTLDEGSTEMTVTDPMAAKYWEATGVEGGGWFVFDAAEVAARVALSTADAEGAASNLAQEHDGFDQEPVLAAARQAWADWLGAVRVWGGTEDQRTIFATALYHTAMMPTLWSDADGRYRGFDQAVHESDRVPYHTDFSLWDTYRTTHPLYTLLWPDRHRELLWSLARMAEQGGALPRWPAANWDAGSMVGAPADIVIGEAVQKGLRDWGEEAAFAASLAVATGEESPLYGGRPDVSVYETYAYYPEDLVGTSVAWTQELCIADAALSRTGALDLDLVDPDTAAWLGERAGWWRNLYDADVGFFHARYSDGSWGEFTSESQWLDEYAEGNARQYLWLVPQDPEGLFAVLGGEDTALARLEEFFEETVYEDETGAAGVPDRWYWHGNEVDLHAPWLFALAGRPDLTRQWVGWVLENRYGTAPDGLAGNDDAGTLSAWYAWAAMGLYPLAGTDRFVLGDPLFSRVEIPVGGGTFTVERTGSGPVVRVLLDGEEWTAPDLTQDRVTSGSILTFEGSDP